MKKRLGLCGLVLVLAAGAFTVVAAQPRSRSDMRLSGTYELDRSRSDDPRRQAESATRNLPEAERDRIDRRLTARLEAPDTLSLDRRGRAITLESSLGERTTFDADGRAHTERAWNGRQISTRAELDGDRLIVTTSGNRGTDFLVRFEPVDDGEGLRVIRRLEGDDVDGSLTVKSYYRRVSIEPRWGIYREDAVARRDDDEFRGNVTVRDGTSIVATLDTPLSTRSSHTGDRFVMTVRSPLEFEGAHIDGVVTQVSHSSSGRRSADLRVDFETIRPRRGPAADFDAVLRSVRTTGGETIRVDSEGGVADDVSGERVQHGAIGAAIGAVIGAIAGGGKGAAIGAVVGGAGGAILVEGRDELDLERGAEVTLTAIAPPRNRFSQR